LFNCELEKSLRFSDCFLGTGTLTGCYAAGLSRKAKKKETEFQKTALLFFLFIPFFCFYPLKQNLSRLIIPAFSSCNLSLCLNKLTGKSLCKNGLPELFRLFP
jgi:hypothetical protein